MRLYGSKHKDLRNRPAFKLISSILIIFYNTGIISTKEIIYTAIVPKVIRPRETIEVYISVEKTAENDSSPISFEITVAPESDKVQPDIHFLPRPGARVTKKMKVKEEKLSKSVSSSGNKTIAPIIQEKVEILPGKNASVKLNFQDLPEDTYNLTMAVADSTNQSYKNDSCILYVERKNETAVIQLDKPIYKPEETISFRVIFLNRQMKPLAITQDKSITIKMLDSQKNTIKIWQNEDLQKKYGIVKGSVELSSEPNLGDWSIEVEIETGGNGSKKLAGKYGQSFKVDKYVLPKFKVDLKMTPNFLTFQQHKFTLTINAGYTYGKPVKGVCSVLLYAGYGDFVEYESEVEAQDFTEDDSNPTTPIEKETKVSRRPNQIVRMTEIDGTANVEFNVKKDLKIKSEDAYEYGKDLTLKVSCKETVSGRMQNATASIKLYKYEYKISAVDSPNSYKPGFPLTINLKVCTQDDIPISDRRKDALKIEHGFSYEANTSLIVRPIPPGGIVSVTFQTPSNERLFVSSIDVSYKSLTQYISVPLRQSSPTKSYMQISMESLTNVYNVGETIEVNVKVNKPFESLNYILVSRGVVYEKERVLCEPNTLEFNVSMKVPDIMAPRLTCIVYVVLDEPLSEIIADEISFDVNMKANDQLKITVDSLNETGVGPGSKVKLICVGSPQSLFAIRAVDQSVLLLAEDKDELREEPLNEIKDSFDDEFENRRVYGGSEAFKIFQNNGLHMLTNGLLEKQRMFRPFVNSLARMKGGFEGVGGRLQVSNSMPAQPMMVEMDKAVGGNSGSSSSGEMFNGQVAERTSFPETWIFKEVEASSDNGTVEWDETLPDTITSWIINGFQINPETGIGLMKEPTKLTVFRPFFISLNVPYSIVQGEVVVIQVLIHNYMSEDTRARILWDNSKKEIEFLEFINATEEIRKEFEIQENSVSSISFVISSKKVGKIELKVKALVFNAGDALSQVLIVRPPGIRHERNHVAFLNLIKAGNVSKEIEATFPKDRVDGGDSIKVSVVGDVLGGTIHNLESLIQLPTGCGEQNMINFVPDVVVLDYLNATDELQSDVETKALRFLEMGYQRQLTYRRSDGSFSAFGESDAGGSTWLTAFVVKSFISAKRYIWIDDVIIQSALEYLTVQQKENGGFVEEGKIIHMGMQGASSNNLHALTAYCLIAFTEAAENIPESDSKFKSILEKGIQYLLDEFDKGNLAKNVYSVIIVTYLLHLLGHPREHELYKVMNDHIRTEDNDLKYWAESEKISKDDSSGKRKQSPLLWNPSDPQNKPVSIEMTAYALLVQIIRDKKIKEFPGVSKEASSIFRWLMKQRSETGGFISTQDTIIGITALAEFAQEIKTPKSKYNVEINVSWTNADDKKGNGSYDFYIGPKNLTVMQEYILGNGVNAVNVTAAGKGSALAQVTWAYYTLESPEGSAFSLSIDVVGKDNNRRLEMKICTAYLEEGSSNMAILELNNPTGYAFDYEDLVSLKGSGEVFKRHELENLDSTLKIYFSSLNATKTCLSIMSYRAYVVAKHAKASVLVYDYYDTTKRTQKFFEAPTIDPCAVCKFDSTCKLRNCA